MIQGIMCQLVLQGSLARLSSVLHTLHKKQKREESLQ